MTAKEYLTQLWDIDKEIDSRIRELEALWARATSRSSPEVTGMPRSGSGKDPGSDLIIKIVDLEKYIDAQTDKLVDLKAQATKAIDKMKNREEKRILRRRYILHEKWEEISEAENWSIQNCHRIHKRALANFEKKYRGKLLRKM